MKNNIQSKTEELDIIYITHSHIPGAKLAKDMYYIISSAALCTIETLLTSTRTLPDYMSRI